MAGDNNYDGLVHRMGLPPVVGIAPKALILGTIPSVISDQLKQYYANPMNEFWKVNYGIWYKSPDADYLLRKEFLKAHRLALWDVIYECDIEGSDDGSIVNEVPNDFGDLFRRCPTIGHVFTNGKKADKIYRRLVDRRLSPELRSPVTCLPSTSPANTIPLGRKMEEWKVVRTFVESD